MNILRKNGRIRRLHPNLMNMLNQNNSLICKLYLVFELLPVLFLYSRIRDEIVNLIYEIYEIVNLV